MRLLDLELFELAGISEPLVFTGETENSRLINGVLHTAGLGNVPAAIPAGIVLQEVAFLKEPGDKAGRGWPDEGILDVINGGWIARNWDNEAAHAANNPVRAQFCDRLSCVDGPILEVAAGPGGGNVSPVLHRNPNAHLIMNDWSYRVLRLWREFLSSHGEYPNLCYATFDARRMPLRAGTVSAISSSGGFSEIASSGAGEQVLEEAFRVLRTGGRMYCMESSVHSDDWNRLPSDIRTRWEAVQLPGGFGQALSRAGFELISEQPGDRRALTPEDSGMQAVAVKHGVKLYVAFTWYEALKR